MKSQLPRKIRDEFSAFYQNNKELFWLSLTFLALKIPSLFEPYWYGDEGITMTVGMAIRKGLLLYRDVYDNKPPILYLIASIANGNLFVFKLFSLFFGLAGVWLFWHLSNLLYQKKSVAFWLANIAFVILTTTPIFEASIVNGEIVFLVFSLAGWYFALLKKNYFAGGWLLALAFLTKAPAAFDIIPLIVWTLPWVKKQSIRNNHRLVQLITGTAIPVIFSFVYFIIRGAVGEYVQSVFIEMVGYTSSWGSTQSLQSVQGLIAHSLVIKTSILVALLMYFYQRWAKQKKPRLSELIFLWFVCSVFGATLSQRPYPHYLLQTVTPLCLVVGFVFTREKQKILLTGVSTVLLITTYLGYHFWRYPTIKYYANFASLVKHGQRGKIDYYRYFDQTLPELYQVADLVVAYTEPNDRIFVWSNYSQLYPMTKRLPSCRTVAAYHLKEKMVKSDGNYVSCHQPPKAIIVDRRVRRNSELMSITEGNYRLAESLTNFDLYLQKTNYSF